MDVPDVDFVDNDCEECDVSEAVLDAPPKIVKLSSLSVIELSTEVLSTVND